jgi:hypothetical protein
VAAAAAAAAVVVAVVVVAVLALAACSGGGGSISATEYRRRVNDVCSDLGRATEALPRPAASDTDRLVDVGRRALALERRALGRVQAVGAPAALERTVGRWLGRIDLALDSGEASLDAQAEGDLAAARAANARGAVAGAEADRLAGSLGLSRCARTTAG